MVDITGLIPLSVGGVIGLLINVVIIAVVLIILSRFIAHEVSVKHSFIMAIIAYLVVPIVLVFANIAFPLSGYVIPLVAWVVIAQVLLKGTIKNRATVAVAAFVVYFVLTAVVGLPSIIAGLLPF